MWNASIHRTHTPPKSAFDWWARLSFGRRKALTNGVTAHKRQQGARLQSISRGCGQHHPNSHLSMMSYGPACECVPSHPSTVCLLNLRRAWFIILRTREKCMCARGKKTSASDVWEANDDEACWHLDKQICGKCAGNHERDANFTMALLRFVEWSVERMIFLKNI